MEQIEFNYRKPLHKTKIKPSIVVETTKAVSELCNLYLTNVYAWRAGESTDFDLIESVECELDATVDLGQFREEILADSYDLEFRWNTNYKLAKALSKKVWKDRTWN